MPLVTQQELITIIYAKAHEARDILNEHILTLDIKLHLAKAHETYVLGKQLNLDLRFNEGRLSMLNPMYRIPHFLSRLAISLNTTNPDWKYIMLLLHNEYSQFQSQNEIILFNSIGKFPSEDNLFNCNRYRHQLYASNITGIHLTHIKNAFYMTQKRYSIGHMDTMDNCFPTFIELIYNINLYKHCSNIFMILYQNMYDNDTEIPYDILQYRKWFFLQHVPADGCHEFYHSFMNDIVQYPYESDDEEDSSSEEDLPRQQ